MQKFYTTSNGKYGVTIGLITEIQSAADLGLWKLNEYFDFQYMK